MFRWKDRTSGSCNVESKKEGWQWLRSEWREDFSSLSHALKKSVQFASSSDFNKLRDWFEIPLIFYFMVSSLQITCPRMLVSI